MTKLQKDPNNVMTRQIEMPMKEVKDKGDERQLLMEVFIHLGFKEINANEGNSRKVYLLVFDEPSPPQDLFNEVSKIIKEKKLMVSAQVQKQAQQS